MAEVFQLSVPSEIANVIHFVIIDLVVVSFVLHATGICAGCINNQELASKAQLTLVPFDVPLIGGGLITWRGRHRLFLILVRISVFLAASASTFGIEGRSEVPGILQSAMIRRPGFEGRIDDDAMERIQVGFSCGTWEGDVFHFGTMANGKCYPEVREYASIQNVSRLRSVQGEAFNCTVSHLCDGAWSTSTYRCDNADIVCDGVPETSGCAGAQGPAIGVDGERKCKAILFLDDGRQVAGCLDGVLKPESRSTLQNCWKFAMRAEDARWWNETYPRLTLFNGRAVFTSANGIEERQTVVLPGEPIPVTVVTIWWVVSVGWLAIVCVTLSGAWTGLKWKHAQSRLYNTSSLLQMLDRENDELG